MSRLTFTPSVKKIVPFIFIPWLALIITPKNIIMWVSVVFWSAILGVFVYVFKQYSTIDLEEGSIWIDKDKSNPLQINKKSLQTISKSQVMVSGKPSCKLIYSDFDGSLKTVKFLPLDEYSYSIMVDLIEKNK